MRAGVTGPAKMMANYREPNNMSTANLYILAKPLLSDKRKKQQSRVATRKLSVVRSKAETEPEARLWKVCAEAASPRLGAIEWIAFPFIGALALGALACSFSESFRLLNSGALDQTVRALLTR
jgi:hypothetical protein